MDEILIKVLFLYGFCRCYRGGSRGDPGATGADPGEILGFRTPPPPFFWGGGGTPKLDKEGGGNATCMRVKMLRFSLVLSTWPDPPPPLPKFCIGP